MKGVSTNGELAEAAQMLGSMTQLTAVELGVRIDNTAPGAVCYDWDQENLEADLEEELLLPPLSAISHLTALSVHSAVALPPDWDWLQQVARLRRLVAEDCNFAGVHQTRQLPPTLTQLQLHTAGHVPRVVGGLTQLKALHLVASLKLPSLRLPAALAHLTRLTGWSCKASI